MFATDLEALYEAVEVPGGLSARLRLEAHVSDMLADAGAELENILIPFAPTESPSSDRLTVRSRR